MCFNVCANGRILALILRRSYTRARRLMCLSIWNSAGPCLFGRATSRMDEGIGPALEVNSLGVNDQSITRFDLNTCLLFTTIRKLHVYFEDGVFRQIYRLKNYRGAFFFCFFMNLSTPIALDGAMGASDFARPPTAMAVAFRVKPDTTAADTTADYTSKRRRTQQWSAANGNTIHDESVSRGPSARNAGVGERRRDWPTKYASARYVCRAVWTRSRNAV